MPQSLIWASLRAELSSFALSTWGELCDFVAQSASRPKFRPPLESSKRLATPELPGVYEFLDDRGRVVYVGMARNLRQRVNQHFRGQKGHDEHHLELISVTRDLTYTTTSTVLEAKLLENRKIKQLRPKYNKALTSLDHPQRLPLKLMDTDLKSHCPPGPKLSLGPYIDHGLIDTLQVYSSALQGDYRLIHRPAWPAKSVDEWRDAMKRLKDHFEALWSDDEEWCDYSDDLKTAESVLSWVAWGRLISEEPRDDDQALLDMDSIDGKAAVLAVQCWRVFRESLWQQLFYAGEVARMADIGGGNRSWRKLSLDAYRAGGERTSK